MNYDEIVKMIEDYGLKVEDITCHHCPQKDTCEYAYDLYNTDGDCLAVK
jgi:hypothetical protein